MIRSSCFLPLLGLFLLGGCDRGLQTTEAVRQGVIDHLASRNMDLSAMQIDVTSVQFRQDEADAVVAFRPKGGGAGSGMQMRYTLERKGNRWSVKSRSDMGGSPHGAGGMSMPPGHPQIGGTPQQTPDPQSQAGQKGQEPGK